MRTLSIHDQTALMEAITVLKNGGVIVYPTDTSYGLGADALNQDAIRKVFALKGRAAEKALSIAVADPTDIERYAEVNSLAKRIIARFLPGPLTIVLPKKEILPSILTGNASTIGIRVPDHDFPRDLVRALDKPITATSANRSGMPTLFSASEIQKVFSLSPAPDLLIDAGVLPQKSISTVVEIQDEEKIRVLRKGAISVDDLGRAFPEVTIETT
ncbi:MAG: threonylcarbamoyl-AMP synthase [Parcubacteria group bacterium]|nr:threonylcarbamoyl-AMP synthase [Parcubacteria group bacterium]